MWLNYLKASESPLISIYVYTAYHKSYIDQKLKARLQKISGQTVPLSNLSTPTDAQGQDLFDKNMYGQNVCAYFEQ